MSDIYLVHRDELYHYGVKGMKWGHRKNPEVAIAKANYKAARKEYRIAERAAGKAERKGIGIKGIAKSKEARKAANEAHVKALDAKVAYKVSKAKNEKQAARAEFNTYKKGMNGIRGSYNDTTSGNKATRTYDHIKAKKGKEYADRVEKRIQNEAYATIAASAAVIIGSHIADMYRLSRV